MRYLILLGIILSSLNSLGSDQKNSKIQEVNFDAQNIDGVVRNPDGSYLVQKRGVDFVPLYKVRDNFDESIKDSVEYLR